MPQKNNPYPFTAGYHTNHGRSNYAQAPSGFPSSTPYGAGAQSTTNLLGPKSNAPSVQATLAQAPASVKRMASSGSLNPYPATKSQTVSMGQSMSDKFSLAADPTLWGSNVSSDFAEPDDVLHNPDPRRDRRNDRGGTIFTARGIANVGCLLVLCVGLIVLFAGFPVISFFTRHPFSTLGAFNLGGTNGTGQVAATVFNLIDKDTPSEAYTVKSYYDGSELELVFSDEFNTDGRTFYPGDDPYWEAVDLHYWQTNNLEWYDPRQITTGNGSLLITLSQADNHNLSYMGGMMTSWNKFCFSGGYIEASVRLPGDNQIQGLWPAVWTMGNLGRAGYGASLDGMWPYSYDFCDVGTVANQTLNGQPLAATVNGDPAQNGILSFLPGQRLSRCTCDGESHPGPKHNDGTYVGRSAPEIDIFEALVQETAPKSKEFEGAVSQSGQWAPFNHAYDWANTTDNLIIHDPTVTQFNSYQGGAFQQATSAVSVTDGACYEFTTEGDPCFSIYGFEYKAGYDDGYIAWVSNGKATWTLMGNGMGEDPIVQIKARQVTPEPMYAIMNLGMSRNFGAVDLDNLRFPTTMAVDYIRIYQPKGSYNVGCDPPDFPTASYIAQYPGAYNNPLLTTWVDDFNQTIPRNSFALGGC